MDNEGDNGNGDDFEIPKWVINVGIAVGVFIALTFLFSLIMLIMVGIMLTRMQRMSRS